MNTLFYVGPGRFFPEWCGVWHYDFLSANYEYGAVDEGYGTEEEDNPPSFAPEGFSEEEYSALNPAEKSLVWKAFWTMGKDDFEAFLQKMRLARSEAESWAANESPFGVEDGIQDALRHSYWQCRMTQLLGESTAREWGNAHEKYATDIHAARMDVHNNSVGRRVAAHFGSCADGVRAARTNKLLMESKYPEPTRTTPTEPPPPPPSEPQ